jgi:polyisoprenoid-binding protein YceI
MSTTEAPTQQAVQTYQLDPAHSTARFSVRHMMISRVHGEFTNLSGSLKFNPVKNEESQVDVEIDVSSINTNQGDRDNHLKSADFFDTATYPKITFTSTNTVKTGAEEGTLTGDLTIHGVTKPVTLHVEGSGQEIKDPWGNWRLGFTARTKIKRSEFGLTYNAALETGGVLVGDDVEITIDAQFVRPGA